MAYPVTKEFREQLNAAVLGAYEAKLEQMAERANSGRPSISEQLKAGKRRPNSKGGKTAEGQSQPWTGQVTSGHGGPKRKGGGHHATQTERL